MNYYRTQREPVGTPAVQTGLARDLYLSAMSIDLDGQRLAMRAFVNPMVGWIWIGAGIMALGGLLAAWPRPRRARAPSVLAAPAAAPPVRAEVKSA
jgi:cytochrome c-type biogenesis protein CcmF